MWIDGHKLTDHCGVSLKPPRGRKTFPTGFKPPRGYCMSNPVQDADGNWGHASCYRKHGLTYLEAIGYRVVKVI
jgi:hypothetical protein